MIFWKILSHAINSYKIYNLQDLSNPESRAVRYMNNSRYYNAVKKYGLGICKSGSGYPKMLDYVDGRFLLEFIENKSIANGRSNDALQNRGKKNVIS